MEREDSSEEHWIGLYSLAIWLTNDSRKARRRGAVLYMNTSPASALFQVCHGFLVFPFFWLAASAAVRQPRVDASGTTFRKYTPVNKSHTATGATEA